MRVRERVRVRESESEREREIKTDKRRSKRGESGVEWGITKKTPKKTKEGKVSFFSGTVRLTFNFNPIHTRITSSLS